jgi:hypothetical protein
MEESSVFQEQSAPRMRGSPIVVSFNVQKSTDRMSLLRSFIWYRSHGDRRYDMVRLLASLLEKKVARGVALYAR